MFPAAWLGCLPRVAAEKQGVACGRCIESGLHEVLGYLAPEYE